MSTVSAADNSTDNFTFKELIPTDPEVVVYGEDSELFPMENHDNINLTDEKLIHSDDNFNISIVNRTIDGNASLLIKSNNNLTGKIYFSFLKDESFNFTKGLLSYNFNNLEKGLYTFDLFFKEEMDTKYVYNISFIIPSFTSDFIPVNNLTMFYKDGTRFAVILIDDNGNVIKNQKIKFVINGVEYNRQTDDNGSAGLNINLPQGNHNILTYYRGSYVHTGTINNFTLSILPTIYGNDIVKIFRNDTQYIIKALDKKGNPLSNVTLKMNINGVFIIG